MRVRLLRQLSDLLSVMLLPAGKALVWPAPPQPGGNGLSMPVLGEVVVL